jgi:putative glutamine amidotransferase
MNVFFSAFDDLVVAAGALPVDVPFAAAGADAMSRLDGLLVTGGQDVHSARRSSNPPPTRPSTRG